MHKLCKIRDKYSLLEIAIYIVIWVILFCVPLLSDFYDLLTGEIKSIHWKPVFNHWVTMTPILLLFFLNNSVLLPQLFWKRRKILYFLVLTIFLTLLWHIQTPPPPHHEEMEVIRQGTLHSPPRPHTPLDFFHLLNLVLEVCVLLANFGVKLYIQSLRRDVQMLNVQNEKMVQELKSLKYQINPHFLMNTLNNIQSLIEIAPERAQKTIQYLSRLMRYMLYDNNAQSVSLQKEIDFMNYFIELMRIRYPETVKISADFPTDNDGVNIPPLLFISFLENAFKYGVSYTEESLISVKLHKDNTHLFFSCANYISPETIEKKKDGGIGIKNVQRRLDLIYGENYQLNISQQHNRYLVEMKLPI